MTLMQRRKDLEAWLPKHLQFTKGWPHGIPTDDECEKLAAMRREICALYGWDSPYLTGETVCARYTELFNAKPQYPKT